MQEILFLVEEDPEGGYTAQAVSGPNSFFTQAETIEELKGSIMDALRCHLDDESKTPSLIRLQSVKDETIRYVPNNQHSKSNRRHYHRPSARCS